MGADSLSVQLSMQGMEKRIASAEAEQKRLEKYAVDLGVGIRIQRGEVDRIKELRDKLKTALAEYLPPFERGDTVRPKGASGLGEVVDIDRAFGGWVVKVRYAHSGTDYTYPSDRLEKLDEDED